MYIFYLQIRAQETNLKQARFTITKHNFNVLCDSGRSMAQDPERPSSKETGHIIFQNRFNPE